MTTYNDSLKSLGITSAVNLAEENPQRFYVTMPHTFGLQLEGGATKELAYPTDIQAQSNGEEHRVTRDGSIGSISLSNQPINQKELDYLVALYHVSMGGLQGFLLDEIHYNLSDRSASVFFDDDLEYEVLVQEGKCSDSYQITSCNLARSNNTVPATLANPTTVTINSNSVPIEYKDGVLLLSANSGTLSLQYSYLAQKLPVVESLGTLPCNTGSVRYVGYWGKEIVFVVSSASSSTVYRLNEIKKNASKLETIKTFTFAPSSVVTGIEYEDSYYFIGLKPSLVKLFKNGNSQDIQSNNTFTHLKVYNSELWFAGRSATNTVVVGTLKPHLKVIRDFGGNNPNIKFLESDARNIYIGYYLSSSDALQISQYRGSWSNIVINPIYPYDSEAWKTVPLFGGYLLYSSTEVKGWLCGNLFYQSLDLTSYGSFCTCSSSLFGVSSTVGGFLDIAPVGGDRAAIVPHILNLSNRTLGFSRFIDYGSVDTKKRVYKISYVNTNLVYPEVIAPFLVEVPLDPLKCDWYSSEIVGIDLWTNITQTPSTICSPGEVRQPEGTHIIHFANGNTQQFKSQAGGYNQYRCYPAGVATHTLTDYTEYYTSDLTTYQEKPPTEIIGANCRTTNYKIKFFAWLHGVDRSTGSYYTFYAPTPSPIPGANKAIVSIKFFDYFVRDPTYFYFKTNYHKITYDDGSVSYFTTLLPAFSGLGISPEGFPAHYVDEVTITPWDDSPDTCSPENLYDSSSSLAQITDCDRIVRVGETSYYPYPFSVSSIRTGLGLQVETCEIKTNRRDSSEDSLFSSQFVESDLYRNYLVSLGKVQISSFVNNNYPIRQDISGWAIGEIKAEDGEQTIELRGANQRLQNKINVKTSPFCPYAFGSPRCGYNIGSTEQLVTVLAVEPDAIRISYTGNPLNLRNGLGVWQTGANLNLRSDIRDVVIDGAEALIYFWHLPPFAIAVGDTLKTYWGCDKTITQCAERNNHLNFGGFPWVPGTHYYLAGSNGAVDAT